MIVQAGTVQKTANAFGWGGFTTYLGLTFAEIDVLIRICVGVVTIVSLLVHLYFKIKSERKKDE